MPEVNVLREVISEDPVERRYILVEADGEVMASLEIDEAGLLACICRTSTLQESRTDEYLTRTRKLMDGEAEAWALDEARRRGEWMGVARQELGALQVRFEDVTPVDARLEMMASVPDDTA